MPWVHSSDRINVMISLGGGTNDQLQKIDYTGLWKLTIELSCNVLPDQYMLDGIPNQHWDVGNFGLAQPFPTQLDWGGAMLGDQPVLMEGSMNLRVINSRPVSLITIVREWITWED